MTTCTNCGTSVREGAKFCTSCGARLTASPAATDSGWGSLETPDQVSAAPSPWSSDALEPAALDDSEHRPSDTQEYAESAREGGGDSNGEEFAGAREPTVVVNPYATSEASAVEQAPAAPWTPPPPIVRPATAWDADWLKETASDAHVSAPEQVADDISPVDVDTRLHVSNLTTQDHSDLAQARTFLDQARDSLAKVAEIASVPDGSVTSPENAGDVLATLRDARQAPPGATSEEIERLRTALVSASDRPRDVDTMLDLVGRIDALGALLAAHDQYAAAIDSAIQTLEMGATDASHDDAEVPAEAVVEDEDQIVS